VGHQTYIELEDGDYAIAHGDSPPSPEALKAIEALAKAAHQLLKEREDADLPSDS
jgi:hypothetical protein